MKITISGIVAAGLASMLAVPASAQASLAERDIEFYAEMLAMGEVCDDVAFRVRRDELSDWVAEQLSGGTEDDLEAVLNSRDLKIGELRAEANRLKEMDSARQRQDRADEFLGAVSTRCRRMAANEMARPFFNY